ncbi:hypothetical protein PHET_07238 [Paragonimus heterotremus]|uniref:Uncharacterized protein n=1 Tax=Paragonimus heterotremus TaxID=100268 RepID=A0A8J4T7V3_9TREM|nr:hypothetical protein PHET_07238 [Paragonimus heterotremus]
MYIDYYQARSLGPGKYNINLDHSGRKSFTDRGPIDTLSKRFSEPKNTNCTPGVGTYGLGGDSYAYKEAMEAIKKSASTTGLLSSKTGAYRGLPESSGHIGPGTYETGQFLEAYLNKVTSLRGPYDLTTGPRSKPILSEYPEPGAYKVQSFMDIWASPDRRHFGKFQRIHETVSLKKTKQIINDSKQPTVVHEVSPATYDPSLPNKKAKSSNCHNVPFLSQASRYDGSLFAGPKIPVGPGRYDIERFDDARCVWGAMCAFDSQTAARMDLKECTKWSERLRPTNIPPSRRFKIDHVSTVKEPSVVLPINGLHPRSIPLIA